MQFDVFHEERSELKAEHFKKMPPISVQFDVFHEERTYHQAHPERR